jgi:hypothetical protein
MNRKQNNKICILHKVTSSIFYKNVALKAYHCCAMPYFSIDELLSEEERVHCVFQTDATDCGFLDPSSMTKDIKYNTKMELPLWMASALARQGAVNVCLTKPSLILVS